MRKWFKTLFDPYIKVIKTDNITKAKKKRKEKKKAKTSQSAHDLQIWKNLANQNLIQNIFVVQTIERYLLYFL